MMQFINSFQSEWIKKRRSSAAWLTIFGAFLIPVITTTKRIIQSEKLVEANSSPKIWNQLYGQNWQFMSVFLLPMGIILTASLIAQIEYRNNAWKQVHTTPQSLTTIFLAKFSVTVIMLIEFFLLFNVGICLSGILPALLFQDVSFPTKDFPFIPFLNGNSKFFMYCLPILSFQYLLSIHIKNFMVPIGIGFALLVASLIAVSWKYGYLIPYTYCSMQFLINDNRIDPNVNILYWSAGYFIFFTILNYVLYLTKRNKG